MRTAVKTLHFPAAGLDCSLSFSVGTVPSENRVYATPYALNVRGTDVFGRRYRGGSRPGFTYEGVEQAKTAELFDVPTTFYRGRKIYADGKLWHASRVGDFADFNVGGDGEDPTRPAMGKIGFASVDDAETITAIFSVGNDALYISTASALWVCREDVTTGAFLRVVDHAGAISKDAWSFDGQRFYFVAANGIYAYAPGEGAVRISSSVPVELGGMTEALMQYDPKYNALHVFTDKGDWYFEIGQKAWWPQKFHEEQRPVLGCTIGGAVQFYCKDGKWRAFDESIFGDDTGSVFSEVVIGPIRCSAREDMDGMFDSFTAAIAKDSGAVAIELYAGKTAEDACGKMLEGRYSWHDTVLGGFNHARRPRIRGAWVCVRLASGSAWAFESMTATTKSLGGLR